MINEEQAEVVRLIFDLYLKGKSIGGIINELEDRDIKSPQGKDKWPKHTLEGLLKNEKYIGVAAVKIGGENGYIYKLNNAHPSIISKEKFDAAQEDNLDRSNVEQTEDGPKRKKTKYSSKKHNKHN